jgi:hypothetical protein
MLLLRIALGVLLLGTAVVSAQQPNVRMKFKEVTAPAEILACLPITIADERDETAERAIAATDRKMDEEARRLGMTKIGFSFVRGVGAGQNSDVFPMILDLCSGIEAVPSQSTEFEIRNIPPSTVNIAYCPSIDTEECLTTARAAFAARQPAPPVAGAPTPPQAAGTPPVPPPPPPVFPRYAFWFEDTEPANDNDLVKTVYGFRDVNTLTEQDPRNPRGTVIAVPKPATAETDARRAQ